MSNSNIGGTINNPQNNWQPSAEQQQWQTGRQIDPLGAMIGRGVFGFGRGGPPERTSRSPYDQYGNLRPDVQFDEQGYLVGGMPWGGTARDYQYEANRVAEQRRQALWGDAQNVMRQGLDLMQTYRPGGSAALASGMYQSRAGLYAQQAMDTEAPDLLAHYRFQKQQKADKATRKAQNNQLLGAGIQAGGAVLGAAVGSVLPGIGTALGGAIGGAAGGVGAQAAQKPAAAGQTAEGGDALTPAATSARGGGSTAAPIASGGAPVMGAGGAGAGGAAGYAAGGVAPAAGGVPVGPSGAPLSANQSLSGDPNLTFTPPYVAQQALQLQPTATPATYRDWHDSEYRVQSTRYVLDGAIRRLRRAAIA